MSTKRLKVIVVGGSLGGLFAALVLKRLGHTVRILERNPTPLLHNQGAGVVAGGDTQAFFSKYDVTQHPIVVTSKIRHYLDREGNQIHTENTVQKMTSWDLLYYVLRANFDGVKSAYCDVPGPQEGEGKAMYSYGCIVKNVTKQNEGIELEYEDNQGKIETTMADLVIGADGPSSKIRGLFMPDVKREYTGYVAWRGTVPEKSASPAAKEAFVGKFAFFHAEGVQILAYTIPGENGSLEVGRRLINWVWYCNYLADSDEYTELMTDSEGQQHHFTLPVGKIRNETLQQQRKYARDILPPQFAEIICETEQPFVQAITDVLSPRNVFLDGKVMLLGDAVAGFRPHTAASTSQAAFHAQVLDDLMRGRIRLEDWERVTMDYARSMQKRGVQMGERSQFGKHPLAQS